MSEKGGIGKTTTAASLAEILANWHAHVLVIDADQQGNLSALFGADDPEQGGLSQLLEAVNKEVKISDVIRTTSNARVDIITANGYLQQTNIPFKDKESAKALVEEYNGKLRVTKSQTEAMKAGSMFGFEVSAADPKNYDDSGQPIRPAKNKDRGDAR